MTKQKHLKARVRARMAKTGESYASARRHVVIESDQRVEARNGYALRGGVHPDTAALANVLADHGVAAERFNRPLSEAMILGIGGGLGAGYILWQFKGHHPIVTLGFRNQWQYPDRWLEKTCRRLGIDTGFEHTAGSVKAKRTLDDSLGEPGPRPLVWIDAQEIGYWHLPTELSGHDGYPVVVYGKTNGAYLIDDRNSAPLTVDEATLQAARGRVSSYRNRQVFLTPPASITSQRLIDAVKEGLRDQVDHLSSTSDSFSIPAWRKWSRMLVDTKNRKGWPNAFAGQTGAFGALLSMYESIESAGYDGGSLRALYAVFLDEASDLLRRSELKNLATDYRELANEWSELAGSAAPRSRAAFATARSLIDAVHEQVFEEGDAGRNAAAAAAAELWDLRTKMQVEEIFTPDEFEGLLRELSGRLEAVSAREQQLIDGLATVVKEVER
jgi:hypothetical protein